MDPLWHLQLSSRTYYFRQCLPHDIADLLDKGEIVRSLRTTDRSMAIHRSYRVASSLAMAMELSGMTKPENLDLPRKSSGSGRSISSASSPIDSLFPSGPSPEMIATVASVSGRSRSETEASFYCVQYH
jgi:Domain of unknown function (DUF6538)